MSVPVAYMGWLKKLVCICCGILISGPLLAQSEPSDTLTLYLKKVTGCKSYILTPVFLPNPNKQDVTVIRDIVGGSSKDRPVAFFRLHGNIAYTFDYRARLDTPFASSNLQQHNEQVYADATFKGRYPFRIYVNSRQSNTPYFRNYTDVNVEFNHRVFQQGIKDSMIAAMIRKAGVEDSVHKYEQKLNARKNEYYSLKNWIDNPARMQDIVEERERLYHQISGLTARQTALDAPMDTAGALAGLSKVRGLTEGRGIHGGAGGRGGGMSRDSLRARLAREIDTLLVRMHQPGDTEKKMKEKQHLADSLYQSVLTERQRIDSFRRRQDSSIRDYITKVRNARSISELKELERSAGTNEMKKGDTYLLGLTKFGIGRSSVSYSDLTVNNISINGINIEYNPSFYAAFAAGSVDYLFRDFVVQPGNAPHQNLVLGRFGWGDKDRRVFIFTVYEGAKNSFGGTTGTTIPATPPTRSMHIFGYSLEMRYRLDKNIDWSLEMAKSSSPYFSNDSRSASMQHAFAFSDRNNEAFSAKANIALPATHTSFNVFYKLIGANFQSYSIFNSGTRQEGWGIRWRQYFFRDQLLVNAQLKKSNFDDPLIASTYSSSMLFKSLQVVYRKKKWPVFSAGYMPSTQLIKSSDGTFSESVYYALTAGIFYDYSFHRLHMNSALTFSRFYNHGTDSGFVQYNAATTLYTHSIDLGRVHMQTDVQYTTQPGLRYWAFQHRVDVSITNAVTIGAGVKNNYVPVTGAEYWGGLGELSWRVGGVGSLRVQYSKDYISNGLNGLVPNDWGRAVWIKVF